MVLNITNGDYFNDYFVKEYTEKSIVFRECMMIGKTEKEIFSKTFIKCRASELSVSEKFYVDKIKEVIDLKSEWENYDSISLWFGKDSFCQLNLLTLLAYLENIGCNLPITLTLIDDESFKVLEEGIFVKLGIYAKLYERILIERSPCFGETGVILKDAIILYYDYLSPNGMLAKIVKDNALSDKNTLISRLLSVSADYGLSVEMAEDLILKYGAKT